MRVLVDQNAIRRCVHIGTLQYQDRRQYFLDSERSRFLLVLRDGLDLQTITGRVVDASLGTEIGYPGFCYEGHVGQSMVKVIVYRVLPLENRVQTTLSKVMVRAPG